MQTQTPLSVPWELEQVPRRSLPLAYMTSPISAPASTTYDCTSREVTRQFLKTGLWRPSILPVEQSEARFRSLICAQTLRQCRKASSNSPRTKPKFSTRNLRIRHSCSVLKRVQQQDLEGMRRVKVS